MHPDGYSENPETITRSGPSFKEEWREEPAAEPTSTLRACTHRLSPVDFEHHRAVCTIVPRRNFALARVLADSVREQHPGTKIYVLVADRDGPDGPNDLPEDDLTDDSIELIFPADLGLATFERWRFRYNALHLSYALTPCLLASLLDRGFKSVLFIKQESLVFGDLTPIFESLDGAPILLTPHLLRPLAGEDARAREISISQSGIYNVGVLGVSQEATARAFLDWWRDRVALHCIHSVAEGMHFEQRWVDMVPAYFASAQVSRNAGWNVGHWALPERQIKCDGEGFWADGEVLRIARFSGFDIAKPRFATVHSRRLEVEALGDGAALFERYRAAVVVARGREQDEIADGNATFDNGIRIPEIARLLYRGLGTDVDRFGNPFAVGGQDSFVDWLNQEVRPLLAGTESAPPSAPRSAPSSAPSASTVTRLWDAVYRTRPDLQVAFPDYLGADAEAFCEWAAASGAREYDIDPYFVIHV